MLIFSGFQSPIAPSLSPGLQDALALFTLVISLAAIVYATGRIVERFQQRGDQNRSKLISDNERFEKVQTTLDRIVDKLTMLEKDLISRRAMIDKEVTVLTMGVGALERRAAMQESRHNRLRDKFNVVVGSLAPVLKDIDADFTRHGTMGKVFQSIDENDESSTDDGATVS